MSYLIDSDVIADWLQGKSIAVQLISGLGNGHLAISIITYGEIYEGIYYGSNRNAIETAFRGFIRTTKVLPLSRLTMERFAHIRGDLRKQGQLLADMDLLIAATAITHNLTLVTGNKRHFARIPGLTIY
jgi:predicted nucleic acid-binding protein